MGSTEKLFSSPSMEASSGFDKLWLLSLIYSLQCQCLSANIWGRAHFDPPYYLRLPLLSFQRFHISNRKGKKTVKIKKGFCKDLEFLISLKF